MCGTSTTADMGIVDPLGQRQAPLYAQPPRISPVTYDLEPPVPPTFRKSSTLRDILPRSWALLGVTCRHNPRSGPGANRQAMTRTDLTIIILTFIGSQSDFVTRKRP